MLIGFEDIIRRDLGEGAFFGAIVENERLFASVKTRKICRVAVMKSGDFKMFMEAYPTWYENLR